MPGTPPDADQIYAAVHLSVTPADATVPGGGGSAEFFVETEQFTRWSAEWDWSAVLVRAAEPAVWRGQRDDDAHHHRRQPGPGAAQHHRSRQRREERRLHPGGGPVDLEPLAGERTHGRRHRGHRHRHRLRAGREGQLRRLRCRLDGVRRFDHARRHDAGACAGRRVCGRHPAGLALGVAGARVPIPRHDPANGDTHGPRRHARRQRLVHQQRLRTLLLR